MKSKLILVAVTLLGVGLRLFNLDSRPLGFTWDEAALGYNAYSLLATGRDEHGQLLPLVFKSFGDYKPGLYIYFTVPSVALLGLSEFSARLPLAVFGTVLITLVYLLAKKFTGGEVLGLCSAFLLAINPWAIHFSRGAWEANLALVLTTLATLLFLRRRLLLSVLFFGFTFWSYQGAKLFTPLLLSSLIFLNQKSLNLKSLIRPFLLLLLLLLPILLGLGSQSGRLKVFSVFSYRRSSEIVNEIFRQDQGNKIAYYLFHSEFFDQTRGIVQRYLNHFSPRFLFFEGDWSNLRHSTPYYGYFHIAEILTLAIGVCYVFKFQNSNFKLILLWLLLAPLPAAFSRDIVSGIRSLPMLIPLSIISGLGLSKFLFLSPALLIFLVYYLDLFFVHSPFYTSSAWLYPYKPALQLIKQNLDKYNKFVISDKLGQPYIFTLFYLQTNPELYQKSSQFLAHTQGDVGSVTKFDKFEFRPIYWPADRSQSSTLFVGDEFELPPSDLLSTPNLIRVGDIPSPDSYPAWRVVALP